MNRIDKFPLQFKNILGGIRSHASYFPCTCAQLPEMSYTCAVNTGQLGIVKTINPLGGIMRVKKSSAKSYKHCTHPPIFCSGGNDTRMLHIIPPPELHDRLGVLNALFKHMLKELEKDS